MLIYLREVVSRALEDLTQGYTMCPEELPCDVDTTFATACLALLPSYSASLVICRDIGAVVMVKFKGSKYFLTPRDGVLMSHKVELLYEYVNGGWYATSISE